MPYRALLFILVACGNPINTENPPPGATGLTGTTGPTGQSGTTSYTYSTQPPATGADAAIALYNTQGTLGAAWVGPQSTATELFVKPTPAAKLSYQKEPLTGAAQTRDGFIAALNARGMNGYAFKTLSFAIGAASQIYYVKNTEKTQTFSYLGDPAVATQAAFLTLLQQRGANGYAYVGDIIPNGNDLSTWTHVFQKDGATTSFSYTITPLLMERASLAAEMEARGKSGELWKGAFAIGADQISLYEKRGAVSAVSCVLDDDAADLLTALNTRGRDGYFYFGTYLAGAARTLVYCKGALTSLPLLGTVLP